MMLTGMVNTLYVPSDRRFFTSLTQQRFAFNVSWPPFLPSLLIISLLICSKSMRLGDQQSAGSNKESKVGDLVGEGSCAEEIHGEVGRKVRQQSKMSLDRLSKTHT